MSLGNIVFYGALAVVCSARAGDLSWKQTTVALEAKQQDKGVEVEFAFTNTTSKLVEIRAIRTSCGCTTTELAKKKYESGESGVVKTVFTFGGRKGRQQKTIIVQTKEGQDILILNVQIPDSIKVSKEKLTWQVGGPLEEQSFEIQALDPVAKVKSVKPLGSNFETTLTEDGKTYRVTVKPVSTERPVNSTIKLEVADPGSRTLYLPVQVQN